MSITSIVQRSNKLTTAMHELMLQRHLTNSKGDDNDVGADEWVGIMIMMIAVMMITMMRMMLMIIMIVVMMMMIMMIDDDDEDEDDDNDDNDDGDDDRYLWFNDIQLGTKRKIVLNSGSDDDKKKEVVVFKWKKERLR